MSAYHYFKIDVYSHHFTLTRIAAQGRSVIESFARQYIQYGLVKEGRRFVRAPIKVFAARLRMGQEYRFHIEQYTEFLKHLSNQQVLPHVYETVTHPLPPADDIVIETLPKWIVREQQVPAIEYILSDEPNKAKLLELQTGTGKAQANDSLVRIPGGWKKMGDIRPGDQVMTPKGTPTMVVKIHPQGEVDLFDVNFGDGRKLRVCEDHLWKVKLTHPSDESVWDVVSTKELRKLLAIPDFIVQVPMAKPDPGTQAPTSVDLCLLGMYLAGKKVDDRLTTAEMIREKLWHLSQDELHIPTKYLEGSVGQREALLTGLCHAQAGKTEGRSFVISGKKLAQDWQYLVRSLGHHCKLEAYDTYHDVARYRLMIIFNSPEIAFGNLNLRIDSVTPAPRGEATCITVEDEDSLYVAQDFIVTHNTFMSVKALSEIKKRFAIIIKPMYIEKWVSDLNEICGLVGDEVVVVQGSAQLMALLAQAKSGELTCKAIIFSNRTLQNWYSLYEKMGQDLIELGYDCFPHQLFELLHVGVRLIDEVHQDFHLNFKIDLYTHVQKSVSLSATLKSDDAFLNKMYEVAYPKPMRFAGFEYNRYINAYSWTYRVNKPTLIRTSEYGSTTYSHHAFEKSIIRNQALLDDYLNMIVSAANRVFFESYTRGDRLLVYCASIQMCTLVVEHLKTAIKGMDVRRYVEEDPYENLMEADVSVSTLLSAGTGVDIPGLTAVVLTTSVSSTQSNIQGFGRLRQLKDKKMKFVYFVCQDIPKHLEYHNKKADLLQTRALTLDSIHYHHLLG